ncbi:MAG: hypothetical protein DHS20C18_07780 [Saprospiraceae bacterium]|nr:MAG: hypothetical protein DHS20C18_07780 [Saprospiraceae bacterium]
MMKQLVGLFSLLLLIGCQPGEKPLDAVEKDKALEELPFTKLALADLSDFKATTANWSVVASVLSDHTKEGDIRTTEGTGVLVNENNETAKDALFTNWEHGDLEIHLEFMMPKGSNSGIYFQGRYELQLLDSWQVADPKYSDCGGIYARWDDAKPEGQKAYEGHSPRLNASKAPGLWQHLHIIFRAPRFDASGKKTENARFEKVEHNGVLIHDNVELFGPTRGPAFPEEGPLGPLMIQGDHGAVAFRNIKYKRYFDDPKLEVTNIHYQYFEIDGPITELPGFDTLKVIKEGPTDSLVYETLSERDEQVAYIFTGKLQVPKTGDYLFHLSSDDGSQLFLDENMVVDNDGKHDFESKVGLVTLEQGVHDLKLTYFNYTWGKGLMLQYEGPEMRQQPLLSRVPAQRKSDRPLMTITPKKAPEMVRSFVMFDDQKITHAISVGDVKGIHYSLNLRKGALLKFWRGNFADVTEMWYERGEPQLLKPLAMAVEATDGVIAAVLPGNASNYPEKSQESLTFKGYDINEKDQPVFRYQVGDAIVLDHYQPSEDGQELIRTIQLEKETANLYTRIAADQYISEVGNGYYSIGGNYYIKLLSPGIEPVIRQSQGNTELLFGLSASNNAVKYAILW